MKDIKIEEAKNQKVETIPMLKKYYMGFTRPLGCDWMSTGCDSDKDVVIAWLRSYHDTNNEFKIISIELPY